MAVSNASRMKAYRLRQKEEALIVQKLLSDILVSLNYVNTNLSLLVNLMENK
jgi:hypothetical protein